MDFFKTITPYLKDFDLTISLRLKGHELTILLLPKMSNPESTTSFTPLTMIGPVDMMDEQFFFKIEDSMQLTRSVIASIKPFEQAMKKKLEETQNKNNKDTKKIEPIKIAKAIPGLFDTSLSDSTTPDTSSTDSSTPDTSVLDSSITNLSYSNTQKDDTTNTNTDSQISTEEERECN
ncbi:hypothetical protein [Xanthocytophaga flava]|uniref:hypothetical protein n=1 Tax=Xanthocytophaga flava TaxID=3048013 RepID=UPI0028D8AE19|nr:hypothetical protein [Xanthocytophaga flavus]MDJ1470212.1 hypothetical protein [Xanthocytophaga flavus]